MLGRNVLRHIRHYDLKELGLDFFSSIHQATNPDITGAMNSQPLTGSTTVASINLHLSIILIAGVLIRATFYLIVVPLLKLFSI